MRRKRKVVTPGNQPEVARVLPGDTGMTAFGADRTEIVLASIGALLTLSGTKNDPGKTPAMLPAATSDYRRILPAAICSRKLFGEND